MATVKIIFFDIDGTLLNFKAKTITPRIKQTLDGLRQKGIKLCISTGRSDQSKPPVVHHHAFLIRYLCC